MGDDINPITEVRAAIGQLALLVEQLADHLYWEKASQEDRRDIQDIKETARTIAIWRGKERPL